MFYTIERMELNDWVLAARKHKKLTQEQLGEAVGRTKANVGHWEKGLHAPSFDMVQRIAEATGFPPPESNKQIQSNVESALSLKRPRGIPVVGSVKAGDDGYLEELEYPVGHGEGEVIYWVQDKAAYALRVKGDSMHPRYRAGEFVVLTPSIEALPGRDVVVILKNGKKLLKLLNWVRDGELQLLSINNGYTPMTIDLSEIERIHRVAGSVPPDAFISN